MDITGVSGPTQMVRVQRTRLMVPTMMARKVPAAACQT
jgi:hypothetical protein